MLITKECKYTKERGGKEMKWMKKRQGNYVTLLMKLVVFKGSKEEFVQKMIQLGARDQLVTNSKRKWGLERGTRSCPRRYQRTRVKE